MKHLLPHARHGARHCMHVFPSQNRTCVYNTHTCKDMERPHHSSCSKQILLKVIASQLCGVTEETLSDKCKESLTFADQLQKESLLLTSCHYHFQAFLTPVPHLKAPKLQKNTALLVAVFHGIGYLLCLIQGSGLKITSLSSASKILYPNNSRDE